MPQARNRYYEESSLFGAFIHISGAGLNYRFEAGHTHNDFVILRDMLYFNEPKGRARSEMFAMSILSFLKTAHPIYENGVFLILKIFRDFALVARDRSQ